MASNITLRIDERINEQHDTLMQLNTNAVDAEAMLRDSMLEILGIMRAMRNEQSVYNRVIDALCRVEELISDHFRKIKN